MDGIRVLMDERDLAALEKALDQLEELHDFEAADIGNPHIRDCLCGAASAWRQARKVTVAIREQLGLRVRLLDRIAKGRHEGK